MKIFDSLRKTSEKLASFIGGNETENPYQHIDDADKPAAMYEILCTSGKVFHLPDFFEYEAFYLALVEWMQHDKHFAVSEIVADHFNIIQYRETKGLRSSLGLRTVYHLYLTQRNNHLIYLIKQADWVESLEQITLDNKNSWTSMLGESYQNDITAFMGGFVREKLLLQRGCQPIDFDNRYIEDMLPDEEAWFYSEQSEDELMLAYLEVSAVRRLPEQFAQYINLQWRFLLTTADAFLVGFNQQKIAEVMIDLAGEQMIVKSEVGRYPVTLGDLEWLTTLNNNQLFADLQQAIQMDKMLRMREIARLNWLVVPPDKHAAEYAHHLLTQLAKISENPIDEFLLTYIELAENRRTDVLTNQAAKQTISRIAFKLLHHDKLDIDLVDWIDRWAIAPAESALLLGILLDYAKTDLEKLHLLTVFRKVRNDVLNDPNCKPNALAWFDLQYCNHLIVCDKKPEAAKILEERLGALPAQDLLDLLPPDHIDMTDIVAGQFLRVALTDALVQARNNEQTPVLMGEAASMQPLVKWRVEQLAKQGSGSLKIRAEVITMVMQTGGLQAPDDRVDAAKLRRLSKDALENLLKHPAIRKQGALGAINEWLGEIKTRDYSLLRSYSEPVSEDRHPVVYNIVLQTKQVFALESLETYIARGEKSVGFFAFESVPPLLLIGADHLDAASPFYMRPRELQFAIAAEMSQLQFKHARVTALDVWRTAREKGVFMSDEMQRTLPPLGVMNKLAGGITLLQGVATVAQQSRKADESGAAPHPLLHEQATTAELFRMLNGKATPENWREWEMLSLSRAMMLTADRAGLLLCGDLRAAIRSMFLTSRQYQADWHIVKRHGLSELLTKQDEDGSFQHRDLAVRMAALFSFFMSDDYVALRKLLVNN